MINAQSGLVVGYPGDAEATRNKERITVRNVVVHNLQNGAKNDVIVFVTFVVHIKCRACEQ